MVYLSSRIKVKVPVPSLLLVFRSVCMYLNIKQSWRYLLNDRKVCVVIANLLQTRPAYRVLYTRKIRYIVGYKPTQSMPWNTVYALYNARFEVEIQQLKRSFARQRTLYTVIRRTLSVTADINTGTKRRLRYHRWLMCIGAPLKWCHDAVQISESTSFKRIVARFPYLIGRRYLSINATGTVIYMKKLATQLELLSINDLSYSHIIQSANSHRPNA